MRQLSGNLNGAVTANISLSYVTVVSLCLRTKQNGLMSEKGKRRTGVTALVCKVGKALDDDPIIDCPSRDVTDVAAIIATVRPQWQTRLNTPSLPRS